MQSGQNANQFARYFQLYTILIITYCLYLNRVRRIKLTVKNARKLGDFFTILRYSVNTPPDRPMTRQRLNISSAV